MTAFQAAALARSQGYALAVERGLFQVQTVKYIDGCASITPHTAWLPLVDAADWLRAEPLAPALTEAGK